MNSYERLASNILYRAAARNETAEGAEGRRGSIKKTLRTSAHSAVKSGGFYTPRQRL